MEKTGNITREELLSYLDVTPTAQTPKYELIGEGFNELTEALNPATKETHYIHQKSGTSSVTGYAPTYDFTAENFAGDPVADYVASIGRKRLTGAEAETTIVNVETFTQGSAEGKMKAYKQKVAIKVDQVNGGTGGEVMAMNGSFLYQGDAIEGDWDPKTKAFTELTSSTSVGD